LITLQYVFFFGGFCDVYGKYFPEIIDQSIKKVEDYYIGFIVKERENEKKSAIHVDINDL